MAGVNDKDNCLITFKLKQKAIKPIEKLHKKKVFPHIMFAAGRLAGWQAVSGSVCKGFLFVL